MRRMPALLSAALFSAALAAPGLHAQGSDAFHVEAFGPAILGSVNYERLVGSHLSARVGVGWMPGFDVGDALHTPMMINVIAGRGKHRVEAGAGAVLVYALNRGIEEEADVRLGFRRTYTTGTLAYRLEPAEGSALHGGIYRVGLTPVYFDGEMYPLFGVSAGFYLSALRKSGRTAAIRR
ncbi:MAG TPA: hypothetical protein VF006_04160 [Longimicrobium sp.]